MALIIPAFQNAAYTEQFTIEDSVYRFAMNWNTRGEFWTLSILDIDLETLVAGIKVVINTPLLAQYKYLPIPQGELFAIDTADPFARIERSDIGGRVSLVYLTEAEVAAL
jgi:hypothetical protein